MSIEERRRRLEALNGGPLAQAPETIAVGAETSGGANPERQRQTNRARSRKITDPLPVDALPYRFAGRLVGQPRLIGDAEYLHFEPVIADCLDCRLPTPEQVMQALETARLGSRRRRVRAMNPRDLVVLDIETCGLDVEPLFLIGMLRCVEGGRWVGMLHFARGYNEEAQVLQAAANQLMDAGIVVTFNGMQFDLPYIRRRAKVHSVSVPEPDLHIDLLIDGRKRYKRSLPNCKLTTLERHVCGRYRSNDTPGGEIPPLYRAFAKSGDMTKMIHVMEHNLMDMATTLDLFMRFYG